MNLVKGFYDIQVNGYAGIDFNQNDLTAEDFHFACKRIKEDGVEAILATIITSDFMDMKKRLANIALYRTEDSLIGEIVCGIRIPFYVLKNYPDLTGADHSIVITNCMAGASAPPGTYKISHIELEVGEDGVVREPGKDNFGGSSVTMRKCFDNLNLCLQMEISEAEAQKLTIENSQHILS